MIQLVSKLPLALSYRQVIITLTLRVRVRTRVCTRPQVKPFISWTFLIPDTTSWRSVPSSSPFYRPGRRSSGSSSPAAPRTSCEGPCRRQESGQAGVLQTGPPRTAFTLPAVGGKLLGGEEEGELLPRGLQAAPRPAPTRVPPLLCAFPQVLDLCPHHQPL